MSRLPIRLAMLLLLPSAAFAQTVTIGGTVSQLTTDPAVQIDPSISGDLVVFTDLRNGNEDIYYVDLATGAEVQVTADAHNQRLHDVDGNLIVYTDVGTTDADVYAYDVTTGVSSLVTPGPGLQEVPSVDGTLVAYDQRLAGELPDLWATDLATGQSFPVSVSEQADGYGRVSGSRIVFLRRFPATGEQLVVLADLAAGTETVLGPGGFPDIDGDVVVFDAPVAGRADSDVFVHDLAAGTVQQIDLPGNQRFAHVSGDLVAFDDDSQGDPDVVVYHRPSGALFRITDPVSAEYLNDIDGQRIVFTGNAAGNLDIWLFTAEVTVEGEEPGLPEDPCADTGDLELLWSGTFVRGDGKPAPETQSFADPRGGGDAVLVVRSEKCASAWADLNGEPVLVTEDLSADLTCRFGQAQLLADNLLEAELRSKPGCSLTFELWVQPAADPVVLVADDAALEPENQLGCSQGSGPAGWLAVLAVLGLLAWRSARPAAVRVRVRRRR